MLDVSKVKVIVWGMLAAIACFFAIILMRAQGAPERNTPNASLSKSNADNIVTARPNASVEFVPPAPAGSPFGINSAPTIKSGGPPASAGTKPTPADSSGMSRDGTSQQPVSPIARPSPAQLQSEAAAFEAYVKWVVSVEKQRIRSVHLLNSELVPLLLKVLQGGTGAVDPDNESRAKVAMSSAQAAHDRRSKELGAVIQTHHQEILRNKPRVTPLDLVAFEQPYLDLVNADYPLAGDLLTQRKHAAQIRTLQAEYEAPYRKATAELTRAFAARGMPQNVIIRGLTVTESMLPQSR